MTRLILQSAVIGLVVSLLAIGIAVAFGLDLGFVMGTAIVVSGAAASIAGVVRGSDDARRV